MQKLIALSLAFIGVAAMVFAWFVLLTTASHDMRIVAIEVGGVVITIAGYFLWQYSNRSCNDLAKKTSFQLRVKIKSFNEIYIEKNL